MKAHPFFLAYAVTETDHSAIILILGMDGIKEFEVRETEDVFREGDIADRMFFLVQGIGSAKKRGPMQVRAQLFSYAR